MNKKIKDLASLCLSNYEYNKLSNLLNQNELNRARLYVDNLIEKLVYQIENDPDWSNDGNKTDIVYLKQIEDEIFNLYVKEDEGEQIKQSVGQ